MRYVYSYATLCYVELKVGMIGCGLSFWSGCTSTAEVHARRETIATESRGIFLGKSRALQ